MDSENLPAQRGTLAGMSDKQGVCERCEILPRKIGEAVDIYLSTPVRATHDAVVAVFGELELVFFYFDDILRVQVDSRVFADLTAALHERLGDHALHSRCGRDRSRFASSLSQNDSVTGSHSRRRPS